MHLTIQEQPGFWTIRDDGRAVANCQKLEDARRIVAVLEACDGASTAHLRAGALADCFAERRERFG